MFLIPRHGIFYCVIPKKVIILNDGISYIRLANRHIPLYYVLLKIKVSRNKMIPEKCQIKEIKIKKKEFL